MMNLFLYKMLFMTELFIAELLFFSRVEKRSYFLLRMVGALATSYIIAICFPLFKEIAYTGWYSSFMFCFLFMVSMFAMWFSYKISLMNAFFCAIAAYTAQHLSYEIFSFIFSFFDVSMGNVLYGQGSSIISLFGDFWVVALIGYIDIYITVYGAIYLLFARKISKNIDFKLEQGKFFFLAVLILLIDIILNSFIVYVNDGYNKTYDAVIYVYNILSCILIFYIQFNMVYVKDIERELELITHALYQSQKQYDMHKESIKLINIKCHDLRHQVIQYAKCGMDKEAASEIENIINIYDTNLKTGNEVLDIVLTEKSFLCRNEGINLMCMADCRDLYYIKEGDLYALFGNILDNAMEAVQRIEEAEKRCISLNAHTMGNFVTITVENYFMGKLRFSEDGLPITTKENLDYHGFGMKSIKAIVEKYDGVFSIVSDEERFRLNIMFPINEE